MTPWDRLLGRGRVTRFAFGQHVAVVQWDGGAWVVTYHLKPDGYAIDVKSCTTLADARREAIYLGRRYAPRSTPPADQERAKP